MYHLKCSHSRASHSYPIYLEIKPATYEQCAIRGGLEHIKQEVDLCAKQAIDGNCCKKGLLADSACPCQVGLKKLERTIMDMQEESARRCPSFYKHCLACWPTHQLFFHRLPVFTRLREVVHEKFFQIQRRPQWARCDLDIKHHRRRN